MKDENDGIYLRCVCEYKKSLRMFGTSAKMVFKNGRKNSNPFQCNDDNVVKFKLNPQIKKKTRNKTTRNK